MSKRNPRRSDFPLLAANPQLHYLDSAATSQKPKVVLDAMRAPLLGHLRDILWF